MAPAATNMATRYGLVTEQLKGFLEERARGGAGLIIVENTSVDFFRAVHSFNRLRIDDDLAIPGLAALAQTIQRHGARAVVQLNHCGRMAKSNVAGLQPVAPSPLPYPCGGLVKGELPRALTVAEIKEIVLLFGQAAARAQRAGFDGIEIHAAHAYLIAEFLSPFSNKRADDYGGSLANRVRLLREVLLEVRSAVGSHYPIWYRLNGREFGVDDGFTIDDARATVALTEDLVDAIHVSTFGYGDLSLANMPDSEGALLPLAAAVREATSLPIIAAGRLTAPVAEQAVARGQVDMIAIARGLIADPDLPNKMRAGRLADIRPCVTCFHCQDAGNGPIRCAVNPATGREEEFRLSPVSRARRVLVIGGGPAGLEAARVLAGRGHRVVLVERQGQLGGQLRLAILPPHKRERLEPLLTYYAYQLEQLKVDVRLDTAVDESLVQRFSPDAVVLATGAKPLMPAIPGIHSGHVASAVSLLSGEAAAGPRVVVIGGGSTGCEIAEYLFEKGKQVTVLETLPELARDMGFRDRVRLLARISHLPIRFLTETTCVTITGGEVRVRTKHGEQAIETDTVVVAAGSESDSVLFQPLRVAGLPVHLAGDCWHVGRIADAINDGLVIGSAL